jgi:hypothetical protein
MHMKGMKLCLNNSTMLHFSKSMLVTTTWKHEWNFIVEIPPELSSFQAFNNLKALKPTTLQPIVLKPVALKNVMLYYGLVEMGT